MAAQKSSAVFISDLGFGDAGKGSIVDFLTRELQAHTIVRYNGGPQAAHNVITPDGKHHTFAQFGSGMFIPGTRTYLSRFMLINPLNLLSEEKHLNALGISDAFARLSIDRGALVITPFQKAANHLREMARGDGRHGSCGEGVGETMSDSLTYGPQVLFAGDLLDKTLVTRKLEFIREAKLTELTEIINRLPKTDQVLSQMRIFQDSKSIELVTQIYSMVANMVSIVDEGYFRYLTSLPGTIIFEGAQGVLLDEWYGFHPYTTWSTTTFANADQLLKEQAYSGQVVKLGLIRAYSTRHGAGPFVSEDPTLKLAELHNRYEPWQQGFRVGPLDLVATRYAMDLVGALDGLVVTNIDRLGEIPEWKMCTSYTYQGEEAELSPYFDLQGSEIRGIKALTTPDLNHQERLTNLLWRCAPKYQRLEPDVEGYLREIGQQLSLPITLTSTGPTSEDKQLRSLGRMRRKNGLVLEKQGELAFG